MDSCPQWSIRLLAANRCGFPRKCRSIIKTSFNISGPVLYYSCAYHFEVRETATTRLLDDCVRVPPTETVRDAYRGRRPHIHFCESATVAISRALFTNFGHSSRYVSCPIALELWPGSACCMEASGISEPGNVPGGVAMGGRRTIGRYAAVLS